MAGDLTLGEAAKAIGVSVDNVETLDLNKRSGLYLTFYAGMVTGVVGAVGGLGGFFPPLVMALVKSLTGSYTLGFVLLAAVAAICLLVLVRVGRPRVKPGPQITFERPGPVVT